jgi:hypothetical protein
MQSSPLYQENFLGDNKKMPIFWNHLVSVNNLPQNPLFIWEWEMPAICC